MTTTVETAVPPVTADADAVPPAGEDTPPLPIRMFVARGDGCSDRGEYDNSVVDYRDALECCRADPSIPAHVTNRVREKLHHARTCLRWTLTAGGNPDHYLLPEEARDVVQKARLTPGYLLTIDGDVVLGCYPFTSEGCREATRKAQLTAFDAGARAGLRPLAGRDDFDLAIFACDGRRATQVCRTQTMPSPQNSLSDGFLVIFRQLDAPVPPTWKPGIRWQAEAHLRGDERYHPIGICWVCDPASVKELGTLPGWVDPCVDYLFVLDGWRRSGVATALVDACRKRWPDLALGEGVTEAGEGFLKSYPGHPSPQGPGGTIIPASDDGRSPLNQPSGRDHGTHDPGR